MAKTIVFYGSLVLLAIVTHVVATRAMTQDHPYYAPCPAAGFIAGIGYIPEQFVCKCTVTTSCGQGNGIGCSYYTYQYIQVRNLDGTWSVTKSDIEEILLQQCLSDDDFEVSLFTFNLDGLSGPKPGQYYYNCGLWKGLPEDPVDPSNLLDAAGIYFVVR